MKYIFFLHVVLNFICCNRSEDVYEYIDKKYYNYLFLPKGSWWVYEEESSGEKDTVTVIGYNSVIYDIHESGCSAHNKEFKTMLLTSSLNKDTLEHGTWYGQVTYNDTDYIINTTSMKHGESYGPIYGVRQTYYRYDSLTVENKKYYDLIILENADINQGNPCNEDFISAKGIGIVQHKTCEGLIWNLVDYHIND